MKRIPRFAVSELEGMIPLLQGEEIPFDLEGVSVGASSFGASTEYLLVVDDDHFVDTCALLMDYFCISSGTQEPFEGDCPACGTFVPNSLDCPDCGLHFGFETPDQVKEHPFYQFLANHSLLPQD
ncbi:MAG: hypothetical protein ACQKBT_08335 [Puniceicoccales bacterium]